MSRSFVLPRYVGAAVFARLADEGARVSILLLVLERTGDPALGGLLIAALMVPHVLAAPVVGAVADAVRSRRLLYPVAYLAYAVCLAAAAAMVGRSTVGAALVLVLAGCVAPLLIGGLSSLLGVLIPAGQRERAFGLDVMSYSVAGIAGPALAAVLAGLAGAAWSTVGLAALVLAAAVLVMTLPLPAATGRRRLASPVAALALMWQRPRLGGVTAGTVFSMAGTGALPLVAALIAAGEHRPELTGVILSAGAAGGLIGSLLCTRWPIRRWRPERVVVVCLAAGILPYVILIFLPGGWIGLPFFALAGGLGAPVSVAVFAVRDEESPPGLRTQVFSLGAGLKVTAAAAGAAAAGLASGAGATVILAAIGLCQLLAAVSVVLVGRVTPTSPEPRSIVSQAN